MTRNSSFKFARSISFVILIMLPVFQVSVYSQMYHENEYVSYRFTLTDFFYLRDPTDLEEDIVNFFSKLEEISLPINLTILLNISSLRVETYQLNISINSVVGNKTHQVSLLIEVRKDNWLLSNEIDSIPFIELINYDKLNENVFPIRISYPKYGYVQFIEIFSREESNKLVKFNGSTIYVANLLIDYDLNITDSRNTRYYVSETAIINYNTGSGVILTSIHHVLSFLLAKGIYASGTLELLETNIELESPSPLSLEVLYMTYNELLSYYGRRNILLAFLILVSPFIVIIILAIAMYKLIKRVK